MTKKSCISVVPFVDRLAAFSSICPQRKPLIKYLLDALRELASNGEDEGATQIRIMIDAAKKIFRVCDNGQGFGSHQKQGFYWLYKSEKKEEHRQGKPTTGQHGTGRLRTLQFATAIEPTTLCEEDGVFFTTLLTRSIAESIWNGDQTERSWVQCNRPPDWHLKPGEYGSCIDIKMSDDAWKSFCDPAMVIDRFAQELSPRLEKIITVNGKHLRPRSILQAFELSISQAEIEAQLGKAAAKALGECMIELYMPQQLGRDDVIKLGGPKNIVCPLTDFLEDLPDVKLRAALPNVITSGRHLCGYFFIGGLNAFVAEDRHSLRDTVYDGFHAHLIRFLAEVVGPKVEEAYTKKERDDTRQTRKKKLTDLSAQFAKAFPRSASGRPVERMDESLDDLPQGSMKLPKGNCEETFVARPSWLHIMPGETQELIVVKHEGCAEEDLEWEIVEGEACGSLSRTAGKKVIFTATKIGKAKILVRSRKDATKNYEISVTVVDQKKLSISPSSIPLEQGASQRFRARNSESTSGKLEWKLSSSRGLRLSNSTGLETSLTVSDDCTLGTYTLTCRDTKNASLEAKATIEVISGDQPHIDLDGVRYYFKTATVRQPSCVVLQQNVIFTSTGVPAGSIVVDFDHPDLVNLRAAGRSEDAMDMMLFDSIALQHLTAEHEANRVDSVQELTNRLEAHRSKLLATYVLK